MDLELSQLESLYLYYLSKYNKILMQRNNLLKQIRFQENLIDTLEGDIQLVKYGSEIIRYRQEFIRHLNPIICSIHRRLTGQQEEMKIEYENSAAYDTFLTELTKRERLILNMLQPISDLTETILSFW